MTRSGSAGAAGAVGALAFLLVVTAAWWALALWPTPAEPPAWLARARWVCFNATPDGIPGASGWLLLVGQPIGMAAALMAIWGRSLRVGLRALGGAAWGRAALAGTLALVVVGLAAAGARVVRASAASVVSLPGDELPPDTYPRLDRDAPELGLVDQYGEPFALSQVTGRPALVTFAFGHCETVCPMVVHQSLEVQRRARERGLDARLVVVTLDPWRDTPSRLESLAERWEIGDDGFVLSGGVDEVNEALDRWQVARRRDPATGDLAHPPLIYVLDGSGRIAYAATGGVTTLLELLERSAPAG